MAVNFFFTYEVIMKESLISHDKKSLNNLFENLISEWTISATEVKKSH